MRDLGSLDFPMLTVCSWMTGAEGRCMLPKVEQDRSHRYCTRSGDNLMGIVLDDILIGANAGPGLGMKMRMSGEYRQSHAVQDFEN